MAAGENAHSGATTTNEPPRKEKTRKTPAGGKETSISRAVHLPVVPPLPCPPSAKRLHLRHYRIDERTTLPAISTLTAAEALAVLVPAVREAGAIGLRFARDGAKTFTKADSSPVTEADLAIDAHLGRVLRAVSPDIGWLSEETADDPERLSRRQVWIVDPIDGTRGFVAGNGEWVVSAALVADGRPLVGVLFRPTHGDFYTAVRGAGAFLNGERLTIAEGGLGDLIAPAGPKTYVEAVRRVAPKAEQRPRLASLALRLAFLAQNRLDAAFAKANAHDWDLAAADLIVQEAAGRLSGFDGDELVYNRPDPVHPPLVAASASRHEALARALRQAQV